MANRFSGLKKSQTERTVTDKSRRLEIGPTLDQFGARLEEFVKNESNKLKSFAKGMNTLSGFFGGKIIKNFERFSPKHLRSKAFRAARYLFSLQREPNR